MASIISVDLEIQDGEWRQYVSDPDNVKSGTIERVGNLPRGMKSGAPAFQLMGRLEDGTPVLLQASWKSMSLAMVAMIAKWGTP